MASATRNGSALPVEGHRGGHRDFLPTFPLTPGRQPTLNGPVLFPDAVGTELHQLSLIVPND